MTIDEGTRVLFLDVMRSQGSLDEVSVDLVTRSITAHSQIGSDVYLATLQQVMDNGLTREDLLGIIMCIFTEIQLYYNKYSD